MDEIHQVEKAITPARLTDNWLYKLKDRDKLYQRHELLIVPEDAKGSVSPRPVFDPTFYNRLARRNQIREEHTTEINRPVETRAAKRRRLLLSR